MSNVFYPRPEAQAVTWDELLTPVSSAVRDLLVRIHGAHQSNNSNDSNNNSTQQTGNCFIVYGSRGTGKTTVLLNAQRAVCRKNGKNFFGKIDTEKEKIKHDAQQMAEILSREGLVWLDILNLEPLPSEANLLTVLLTQVLNALNSNCGNGQNERRSIFEEEANSARQQLNHLINDATLMWQNIKEQDTRNTSNRQVKAADIYAGFQERFKKAIDTLVNELKDRRSLDNKPSIVLPIDNIDRSTDHLQSIVKLAQLVSHPNLWLVMAGDRVEVETFLERAYWKELIRSNDGAGAQGKLDSDGEDEALLMARRQANAIAQKLWPANHRVEVNLVKPEETLQFKYKQNLSNKRKSKTIENLLQEIQIPTLNEQREKSDTQENDEKEREPVTLLNFFDVSEKVREPAIKEKLLTRAARHGLLLPARSVLDLWQLLDWLVNDISVNNSDFKAEKVARTMLRNAIDNSKMPNAITQKLQTDIIRRGEKGGTILYLQEDVTLKVELITSINNDFDHTVMSLISTATPLNYKLRSQLYLRNVEDITLQLLNPYPSIPSNNPNSEHFVIKSNKKMKFEISLLVTGWLMVLYDVLVLADNSTSSWVNFNLDIEQPNVSINHTVLKGFIATDIKLYWSTPNWELFWGRNIFGLRWQNFRKAIIQDLHQYPRQEAKILAPKLLAAGWIFCVLKTAIVLINSIDPLFDFQEAATIPNFETDIEKFEHDIMLAAARFYELIQNKKAEQQSIISAAYEIMIATGEWLETELLYFLSFAYVPIEPKASKKRFETLWELLKNSKDSKLYHYWEDNLPFILAELDEKLSEFENSTSDKKQKDPLADDDKSLAQVLFSDLYRHLEPSDR